MEYKENNINSSIELKKFEYELFIKEYKLKDSNPRIAEQINELRKSIAKEVNEPMPSELFLSGKATKENIAKVLSYIDN